VSSSPTVASFKESEKFPLEAIAKGITYSLPFLYVCGFIVLSLFEAEYGIADLSLVRVKALATGLLFVFFIGYPALVGIRSFQLLGLKKPGATAVVGSSRDVGYFYVIKISSNYMLSVFSSTGLLLLFAHRPRVWIFDTPTFQEPSHFSILTFSAGLVSFFVFTLGLLITSSRNIVPKHFATKPGRCAVLAVLVSVLWFIWNAGMSDWTFVQVAFWSYLVGLVSILFAKLIEQKRGPKALDWEVLILMVFVMFVPWFASSLYGTVKPAFGGGSAVPARLYLKEKNAVLQVSTLDAQILEETEQGYYIVSKPDSKSAIFIPRSTVSTAEFNLQKQ
jgi:hypothetical protein